MMKMKAVQLNTEDKLIILDQSKLPGEEVFLEIKDKDALIEAIGNLRVRGAPAIGIAAGYGIYVLAKKKSKMDKPQMVAELKKDMEQIRRIRPTAINLSRATQRMAAAVDVNQDQENHEFITALRSEAIAIDEEEAAISRSIASYGASLIKDGMGNTDSL